MKNVDILSKMAYVYNNYSLITPIDYDYETLFINFGKIYCNNINFYKKFYSYDYNFYQYPVNFVGIYKRKGEYYNKLIINNNALYTIYQNENENKDSNGINNNIYYISIFEDIIYTKYANVFYNVVTDGNIGAIYYVDVFIILLLLYIDINL